MGESKMKNYEEENVRKLCKNKQKNKNKNYPQNDETF